MKYTVTTQSSEQTLKLAQLLGSNLRGGEVIEFISDIGGGKTTFVRGLVKGAGSENHVSSPTFKISNIYKTPRFLIHHFDFYRLNDPGLIEHELHDVLLDGRDVVVVEWSDVVAHVLPDVRLIVHIHNTGQASRTLEFTCPDTLDYLLDNVNTNY